MKNTMENGGAGVQILVCDRRNVTEITSELSLPDYQPEIRRLLRVTAKPISSDAYLGAGNADVSGVVEFCILYEGNDGTLTQVAEDAEYSFALPLDLPSEVSVEKGLTCTVDGTTEGVSGKVVAPRKVSLRCRLRSRVRCFGVRETEESLGDAPAESLQRLCKEVGYAEQFFGVGEPLRLEDEILCDADRENLRVIGATGEVFVSEVTAGSEEATVRGEVVLKLLVCRDGSAEPPEAMVRRIPFSQVVPLSGGSVNCDCVACGVCSDFETTVEDGRILCDMTVRLRVAGVREALLPYTEDVYSTSGECRAEYRELPLPTVLPSIGGNFTVNMTLPLNEAGIRQGLTALDLAVTPQGVALDGDKGKYILTGKCRCHIILSDGNETSAEEFEIPFRYETDGSEGEIADYDVTVTPISARARIDGERIGIDAELAVSGMVRGVTRPNILTSVECGKELERAGAGYLICYPAKDDTLWSVAKRYHRPVEEIVGRNPLPSSPAADAESSLDGVKYLMI